MIKLRRVLSGLCVGVFIVPASANAIVVTPTFNMVNLGGGYVEAATYTLSPATEAEGVDAVEATAHVRHSTTEIDADYDFNERGWWQDDVSAFAHASEPNPVPYCVYCGDGTGTRLLLWALPDDWREFEVIDWPEECDEYTPGIKW